MHKDSLTTPIFYVLFVFARFRFVVFFQLSYTYEGIISQFTFICLTNFIILILIVFVYFICVYMCVYYYYDVYDACFSLLRVLFLATLFITQCAVFNVSIPPVKCFVPERRAHHKLIYYYKYKVDIIQNIVLVHTLLTSYIRSTRNAKEKKCWHSFHTKCIYEISAIVQCVQVNYRA